MCGEHSIFKGHGVYLGKKVSRFSPFQDICMVYRVRTLTKASTLGLPPWMSRVKGARCAQGWSTWPWPRFDTRVRTYFSVGSLLQIRAGETLLLVSWIRPIASCPGDHTPEGRARCHKHPACPGGVLPGLQMALWGQGGPRPEEPWRAQPEMGSRHRYSAESFFPAIGSPADHLGTDNVVNVSFTQWAVGSKCLQLPSTPARLHPAATRQILTGGCRAELTCRHLENIKLNVSSVE